MADRYWVQAGTGGNGDWDDITHWSTSSGGSGGSPAPIATTDTAVFDVNSFSASGKNVIIQGIIVDCHITTTGAYPFEIMIDTYELTPGASSLTLHEDLHLYYLQINDTLDFNGFNVYAEGVNITDTGIVTIGSQSVEIEAVGVYDSPEFAVSSSATVDFTGSSIIFRCYNGAGNSFNGGGHEYGTVDIRVADQFSWYESMTCDTLAFIGDGEVILGDYEINITMTVGTGGLRIIGDTFGGLVVRAYTEPDPVYTGNVTFSSISGLIDVDNCTLINTTATGGATFAAPTADGNIDGGGNTGWDFGGSSSLDITVNDSLGLSDNQEILGVFQELTEDVLVFDELYGLSWASGGINLYDIDIIDYLQTTDAQTLLFTFPELMTDNIDLIDFIDISWLEYLIENLDMIDAQSITWIKNITELLFLYDDIKNGWLVSVSEDLTLTDTLTDLLGLVIHDYLTMIDSQSNNWNGREIISDNITLFDIIEASKRYADYLSDSIDMTDLSTYVLSLTILEYMGFTELVQGIKSLTASASDNLDLSDSSSHALALLISETLSVVDANSVITTFVNSIQSDLGLTDVSSLLRTIGIGVTESLVLTETIGNKGTLYSAIYDTLTMNVTVELNGDVYECYVLNTPKFYPSMYSGFEFNSFCVFENRAFGANDTGIFELTGSTDNGATIHSGVILSETDFGAPNQKRFRKGYLGISGNSPVMVFETDDGKRQAYTVDTNGKITVSHELKGKSWILSVADFDTLDSIKLIPIILTK